eukprot:CAMPEP_0198370212 /NCGR_PEP_ID=MMETSP1450-20131203/156601_1 /TAXON_ID=753684 ORGANISM="Madagascaria erythrocladiodes, Strain CCMP3234" /NCGR_SAMPLE_ID=MMETSP1450 /ASSEMBLY_ACC=CAM_ASM_001115 /LENGTH=104 /DNA_ID=CAMNT_0044077747 /DNA_START=394 /DNA_END=708 /DNA_ORIENTATION=+
MLTVAPCRVYDETFIRLFTSQTKTPSLADDARKVPVGERATSVTGPACFKKYEDAEVAVFDDAVRPKVAILPSSSPTKASRSSTSRATHVAGTLETTVPSNTAV